MIAGVFINRLKLQEMTIKSLKSVLKFWQEIVFAVSIGFVLTELAKAVILGHAMDGWDIFSVCFFMPLLICLIGQFFWKSRALTNVLSVLLGISSFAVILMAMYGISTTSIETIMIQSVIMLIGGIIGVVAAITMTVPKNKFAPDNFGKTVVS
jgi:peptidoglycan/LPS O-acetylase OafA/YrhL